jgi:hypothetical protein
MAFLDRIHARGAYKRALERGGPYSFQMFLMVQSHGAEVLRIES